MWPEFAEDEIIAAETVLRSGKVNYWTGEECRLFEHEFSAYHDSKYGIAVANGTVALELALWALDIGPGDEVIVSPKTFLASVSAIVMRGAKPVFADIDLKSQNITPESIQEVIAPATKAIICVHLAGWPCEMDRIMELANKQNIFVIEDCAQAHGAKFKGKSVGSWGHINAFSFCQDKIMTTGGEGGMLLTNDTTLWKRAWSLKDHGKDYDAVYNKKHPSGFRWLHEHWGTNFRMTEMQAAIGRVQLQKLTEWVAMRRSNAALYDQLLADIDFIRVVKPTADYFHSYYKYYCFLDLQKLPKNLNKTKLLDLLHGAEVPAYSGSCSEVYNEKCFDDTGFRPIQRLEHAHNLGNTAIMFLVDPTVPASQIQRTVDVLSRLLAVKC